MTLVIDDAPLIRGFSSPEIHLAGVGVDQHVDLEEALVALAGQPVAEPADQLVRLHPALPGQRVRVHLVAAPATLVRGQFGVPDEFGHERADQRAVPGQHRLDRDATVVDPLHDLLLLADDVVGVLVPVLLLVRKKVVLPLSPYGVCSTTSVPSPAAVVSCTSSSQEFDRRQDVRHAGCAGLVAEPGGDDLGIQVLAQRRRRQDQVVTQFRADLFGLLVEEDHRHLGPAAAALHVGLHLVGAAAGSC